MVNIPPLLCSTPPPIDFGEEEEEDDCKIVNVLALADDDDDDDIDDDDDDDNASANDNINRNDNNYNNNLKNRNKNMSMSPTNGLVMDAGVFITNITPPPLDEDSMDHNSRVKKEKIAPVEAINLHVAGGNYDQRGQNDNGAGLNDNKALKNDEGDREPFEKSEDTIKQFENEIINVAKESAHDRMEHVAQPTASDDNENVAETTTIDSKSSTEIANSQLLFNQVSLEDVEDDDLSSPINNLNNNNNNIVIDEQSADYFAIHILTDSAQTPQGPNETSSATTATTPKDTTDKPVEGARVTEDTEKDEEATISPLQQAEEETKSNNEFTQEEFEADFTAFAANTATEQPPEAAETSPPSVSSQQPAESLDILEDFGTFPNEISSKPNEISSNSSNVDIAQQPVEEESVKSVAEEKAEEDADDFDDFQDFTWHEPTLPPQPQPAETLKKEEKVQTPAADNVDDDFADDFGDFEEATFTPAPAPTAITTSGDSIRPSTVPNASKIPSIPTEKLNLDLSSIKTNLEPVLKMMFPATPSETITVLDTATTSNLRIASPTPSTASASSSNSYLQTSLLDSQLHKQSKIQLQSIDSARALQYQWAKSTGRYALIKSLGIDARNVLFGEKWSKPIFAADLTSLPLKPINYQTTTTTMPVAATTATSGSLGVDITNVYDETSASVDIGNDQATLGTAAANQDAIAMVEGVMQPQHMNPPTTLSDDGFDQQFNVTDTSLHMMCPNYNNAHELDETTLESTNSDFHSIETKFNPQSQQLSFDVTSTNSMETTLTPTRTPTEPHTQHSQILNNAYDTTTNSSFDFDIMDIETKLQPTLSFNNKSLTQLHDYDMPVRSSTHSSGASSSISGASSTNSPIASTTAMDNYMVTNYNSSSNINNNLSGTSNAYDTMSDIDEVIVTSTYSGPLKETHIYTPPKANAKPQPPQQPITLRTASPTKGHSSLSATTPTPTVNSSKASPIDFDYVMASVGIIIDETVVKKEYRDIEYNPEFDVQSNSEPFEVVEVPTGTMGTPTAAVLEQGGDRTASSSSSAVATPSATNSNSSTTGGEWDDDFTEFQSAPLPQQTSNQQYQTSTGSPAHKNAMLGSSSMPGTPSRGIILSPAILIPQAIHTEQSKKQQQPTNIEWGVSASNINPDELARIEALFSQTNKNNKPQVTQSGANQESSSSASSSQRNTPKHTTSNSSNMDSTSFSISATIASKERRQQQQNFDDDDDDWSEFVYVPPVAPTATTPIYNSNNSYIGTTPSKQPTAMPLQVSMPWATPSGVIQTSSSTFLAQQQQQQQQHQQQHYSLTQQQQLQQQQHHLQQQFQHQHNHYQPQQQNFRRQHHTHHHSNRQH